MKRSSKSLVIGVTGGVGAGKSSVVSYLEEAYGAEVFIADLIGQALEQPGEDCFDEIVETFGRGILMEDGGLDRGKLSEIVFSDDEKLSTLDAIVHPAVRAWIEETIEELDGIASLFVIEAALLIESGFGDLCDEIWYIHAEEEMRTKRLLSSRDYTQKRIRQIMQDQLSEEEFRNGSDRVIDNNGSQRETFRQVDQAMAELKIEKIEP